MDVASSSLRFHGRRERILDMPFVDGFAGETKQERYSWWLGSRRESPQGWLGLELPWHASLRTTTTANCTSHRLHIEPWWLISGFVKCKVGPMVRRDVMHRFFGEGVHNLGTGGTINEKVVGRRDELE